MEDRTCKKHFLNLIGEYNVFYGRKNPPKDLLKALDNNLNCTGENSKKVLQEQQKTFIISQEHKYYSSISYTPNKSDKNDEVNIASYCFKHVQFETRQYGYNADNNQGYIESIEKFKANNINNRILYRHERSYYWNDTQENFLDLETAPTTKPLLHHQEKWVSSEENMKSCYDKDNFRHKDKNLENLFEEAGLRLENNNYWQPSSVYYYDKTNFYQINKITHLEYKGTDDNTPLFYKRDIKYDNYSLAVQEIIDYLWI